MESVPVTLLLVFSEDGDVGFIQDLLLDAPNVEFNLQFSQSYDHARSAMIEGKYDICLLDERVGQFRGIDLIHRATMVNSRLPIVLLAQADDYDLDMAASRAGAADFVVLHQLTCELLGRALRHAMERKRIETSLGKRNAQLAAIVEGSEYAIKGKTLDGIVTSWNPAAEALYGYSADEMIGQPIAKLVPPDRPNEVDDLLKRIAGGEKVKMYETVRVAKDGAKIDVALSISPIRDETGSVIGASTFAVDIKQRKETEARIERQILRAQALRHIDMAITGSLDLRVTLNVLLDQVTTHLEVDAAAVLLLNSHSHHLEYVTGRGFRTTGIQKTSLGIGDGAAGRAAHERRIIAIPDLALGRTSYTRHQLIAKEGFVSYYAAPLVTKGRVEGVLEIYHRSTLRPDDEWTDFLETLAGQAAIAIENAELFTDLQRSNVELEVAYDSTLEGWSKALDLRDKETEGHTSRVTEATVALARAMDVRQDELIQMRRGALLHDIGKMGIPDSILLKPGPLTEDEWTIMRRHPVYAYELLSPIPFLRGALDIPYCHHEKWDGSGYPRGLRGEQIPVSARIFALVDVWDALRSDRPYRQSWNADRCRDYISGESGAHFEPKATEAFLNSATFSD